MVVFSGIRVNWDRARLAQTRIVNKYVVKVALYDCNSITKSYGCYNPIVFLDQSLTPDQLISEVDQSERPKEQSS